MRIAIATCAEPPVPDLDARRVLPALESAGHSGRLAVWDDPQEDWEAYDVAWISSTWDYHERPEEFREWLERAGELTRLENHAGLVEWNLDKRYLRDLEAEGVPVIPTVWSDGDVEDAADAARDSRWEQVVVKPAIDLGAQNLRRVPPARVATTLAGLGAPALVQPFLPALEQEGELSLVYLGGDLSHAVRKVPADGDFRVQEQYGGTYREASPDDEAVVAGERTMAALDAVHPGGAAPLYARVDLVRDLEGRLCVIELELIEPSLFFDVVGDEPAGRFASLLAGASE